MAESNRPNGLPADVGAYLGAGTKINGKLHFEGQATIEGEVDGEIVSQAHVMVGQQATIKGKMIAQSILVQGKVMADVVAEKKLEIQPPGSVLGDVTTLSLVIGDGAILEGHISMKEKRRPGMPLRQDVEKRRRRFLVSAATRLSFAPFASSPRAVNPSARQCHYTKDALNENGLAERRAHFYLTALNAPRLAIPTQCPTPPPILSIHPLVSQAAASPLSRHNDISRL